MPPVIWGYSNGSGDAPDRREFDPNIVKMCFQARRAPSGDLSLRREPSASSA